MESPSRNTRLCIQQKCRAEHEQMQQARTEQAYELLREAESIAEERKRKRAASRKTTPKEIFFRSPPKAIFASAASAAASVRVPLMMELSEMGADTFELPLTPRTVHRDQRFTPSETVATVCPTPMRFTRKLLSASMDSLTSATAGSATTGSLFSGSSRLSSSIGSRRSGVVETPPCAPDAFEAPAITRLCRAPERVAQPCLRRPCPRPVLFNAAAVAP